MNYSFVRFAIVTTTLSLTACGPSKTEIAAEAKVSEQAQEIAQLNARLASAYDKLAAQEAQINLLEHPPQRKIRGEVFIATMGGTSAKLGGVEIAIVERSRVDEWVRRKTAQVVDADTRFAPTMKAASLANDMAREAVARATAKYNDAFNDLIRAGFSDERPRYEKIADAALEQQAAANQVHEEKLREFNRCIAVEKRILSGESYFDEIPEASQIVRTDSDGRFEVELKGEGSYVALARALRSIGEKTENYYWVVPIPSVGDQSSELILDNHNLSSTDSGSLIHTNDS